MIIAGTNAHVPKSADQDSNLSLTVISRTEEFDHLRTEWNRLLDTCDASIYQTFEWQRAWWEHFGDSNTRLHIVALYRDDRVVGIAPFFVAKLRTFGILPLRKLSFIGQGPSDYLDVVFATGDEQACALAVAEHLAEQKKLFDIIHLQDFTERRATHSLLFEALKNKGFSGEHFVNDYCPRTALQNDWEATLASFEIDTRREIRRRARNIQKNFQVEFEVITREEDAVEGLEAFIQLHQHKWRNDGYTGEFADQQNVMFHRDVVRTFASRGWLWFAFLRVNGERVASLYCFMYRNDLAIYLTGNSNRSDIYKFSPGRVLTAFCMEQAVAQGRSVCDFMRGTEPYKYELDAKDVPNWGMLLYNPQSMKPEIRYRIDLLSRSLKRRTIHEHLLYKIVAREHGIFSTKMREHIKARLQKNLQDGTVKVKAPERGTHLQSKKNT